MRFATPLTATVIFLSASTAFAVGSNDEKPPKPTPTSTECTDAQIYDERPKPALIADKQSFNDTDRYDAVRELAYAGAYDRALKVIDNAENQDDPRFLNYRGFIARKQGKTDSAMTFYQAALDADPDYLLARSYMGMGYVTLGDAQSATEQLREISARGGKQTWAYIALKRALVDGTQSSY